MRGRLPSVSRDVSQQRAPRPLLATRSGGVAPQLVLVLLVLGLFAMHSGHRATLASLKKDAPVAAAAPVAPPPPRAAAPPPVPPNPKPDVAALVEAFEAAERAVADVKRRLVDKACHAPDCWWQAKPEAAEAIAALRAASRAALAAKYGAEPHVVRCRLEFPASMPDFDTAGPSGDLVWTMGPADAIPYSTLFFLERVVARFEGGAFHRNAPHVLQAQVKGASGQLAFQEASPEFPHAVHTLGFAGRPGGAGAFYVNTIDNVRNHGGDRKGEPDAILGKLLGAAADVATRMRTQPGGTKPNGFVNKAENHIRILGLELLEGEERRAALDGASF